MSENQPSGPNVFGSIIKNPSSQQFKYMQWGVPQSNTNQNGAQIYNSKRNPSSNEIDQKYNRKIVNQFGQDGNQYYTEYSQVSAIETGFKKLKTNQIQILKQLKKEYEVLRNSSLDSRIRMNNKVTSESQSNGDSNSVSMSDAQSSIASKTRQNRHKRHQNKELQLADLQKKQLELMLNNSMKKIQELLHNQIQLKKNILQLKSKLQSNKISESEYDIIMKRNKQSQQKLQKCIQDYKKQNETLRSKVKDLILSIGNMEGNVNIKQVQLKKKQEKIKIIQEEVHLQRNKYASLELDLKKLKMEYEILEKSKNEQISLLMKSRHHVEEQAVSQKNTEIKRLKQQLEVKDERYAILINKLNKDSNTRSESLPSVPIQRQQEKQYNKTLQKLIQTLKEQKNQQSNESINLIMSKLSQLQYKPDQHLLLQINNLRHQLQIVKQSNNANQSQIDRTKETRQTISLYEQKIRQLQKIIQEENIQKIYFMEDLKKLTKDYNNIKREKEQLIKDDKELKNIIDRLEQQNRRYRNQIDTIKNVNVDLTESQHQNKSLMVKLQHMNLRQIEINNIREEFNKRIDEYRQRQQINEEEIRVIKRQLNQQEFKVTKERQEGQLRLKLMKVEYDSQIKRLHEEVQRITKSYAIQKNNLIDEKIKIQKRLLDKTKELDDAAQKMTTNLKDKSNSLQKIKSEQDFIFKRQQERHSAELNGLFAKLQSLNATNERLLQQSHKYALIQQQILELKRLMRMNRKVTQAVDHLWQVKETEYSNINEILKLWKE